MQRYSTVVGLVLTVLLVTVAVSGVATAHGGDDGTHHHDGPMGTHGGMGWGMGWGLWFIWPALALLLAGAGAYLLVTRAGEPGAGGAEEGDDALAVLRERYARGDIDDEEFERRRATLDADER